MKKYFVDTSFWKALVDSRDEHHAGAKAFWLKPESKAAHYITSQVVFAETVTLLKMRRGLGAKVAEKWGEAVLSSSRMIVAEMNSAIFEKSWQTFKKFEDQNLSFVDCSSFQFMKALKISDVLAYDEDFKTAGFNVLP